MVYYNIINYQIQPTLQAYQSSNKIFYFEVKDNNDNIIDISGLSGTFNVFLDIEGTNSTDVISKAINITDGEKGRFTVNLADSDLNIDNLSYKYRVEIVEDVSNTLIFGDGIFNVTGDEDSRIAEIRKKYQFKFDYLVLNDALSYARQKLLSSGFIPTTIEYGKTATIEVDNYIADSNFDETIDENDIRVYEYTNVSPYTVTELNDNISSITVDHPSGKSYIVMDDTYPSATNYHLAIDYYRILDKYSRLKPDIKLLEESYVIEYLFMTLEPYSLQQGMTDLTLNGITISFDCNCISEYQKKLNKQIMRLTLNISGFGDVDLSSVKLSKRYKNNE